MSLGSDTGSVQAWHGQMVPERYEMHRLEFRREFRFDRAYRLGLRRQVDTLLDRIEAHNMCHGGEALVDDLTRALASRLSIDMRAGTTGAQAHRAVLWFARRTVLVPVNEMLGDREGEEAW